MDKEIFLYILEAALLNFDNANINNLTDKYLIPENLANVGIKLCNYLKSIELNERRLKNEI